MKRVLATGLLACVVVFLSCTALYSMVDVWQEPVDLKFKDVPLEKALDVLFKDTGTSYVMERGIEQLKVTAILKNVPRESALDQVLRSAGATFVKRGDVFYISSTRASSDAGRFRPLEDWLAELTARQATELQSKTEDHPDIRDLNSKIEEVERRLQIARYTFGLKATVTEVVPLKYLNPGDVVPLLMEIRGLRRATGTSGGKLFVSGTEEAIKEAARIVSLLDDESALRRCVRLKLEARITGSGDTEKPITRTLSTEGIGVAEELIRLDLDRSQMPRLDASIKPTVAPDSSITLAGSGILYCPARTGLKRLINHNFQFAVPVVAGKPKTVTSGSVDWDSYKVNFEVQVTATIEEGRLAVPRLPPRGRGRVGEWEKGRMGDGGTGKAGGPRAADDDPALKHGSKLVRESPVNRAPGTIPRSQGGP